MAPGMAGNRGRIKLGLKVIVQVDGGGHLLFLFGRARDWEGIKATNSSLVISMTYHP